MQVEEVEKRGEEVVAQLHTRRRRRQRLVFGVQQKWI